MPKYEWMGGYIITRSDAPRSVSVQIVGRVMGQDGYAHYQLAARPYDEVSVGPYKDRQAAFDAAVAVLEARAKATRQLRFLEWFAHIECQP